MKFPSFKEVDGCAVLRGVAVGVMLSGLSAACGDVGPNGPERTESSSAATTVCGQNTVHGMDVSHYDGNITWATAKANGIDFAFTKATESTGYVDPTFAANWAGMKANGVVRGAYHFFRANADPIAQANHVVATVGALEAGDLPIVLDLETTDGQTGATIGAAAVKFLDAVTAATGKTAIVYTSPGFITGAIATTPGLGRYTLWVANWGVSCPNVPSPWSTWGFWQRSATGTVPGVPASAVDLNTFNGTLAQLHAFGGSPASDAGTTTDAGGTHDAGGGTHDGGTTQGDAASGSDAAAPHDDGGPIGHGDAGGGGGGDAATGNDPGFDATGQSAGCSVGRGERTPRSVWLLALFGAIAVSARRRRRP